LPGVEIPGNDPHHSFEAYSLEIDPEAIFRGEPDKADISEYVFVIK
jgi:hypothetical protein